MASETRVPLWRNPYVWAFVIGCVTITLMRPLLRRIPPPPPVLGTLPAFELVDPHGKPFGSADLRGQVYVASFFFTRCPSVCPLLMTRMKQLQDRFRAGDIRGIHVVSITVDPANDTPEVLRDAEPRYGVDEARWTLLTGPPDRVRALCVDGFHVPGFEQAYRGEGDIPHTTKVVLVDREGRIRGYYDTDESGLDEVYWRAQHVRDDTTTGNG
jgi:protein SCO1/2